MVVYFDKEKNVTVVQQRSPFISRQGKTPFVRDLWRFISCYGFSKVIMLASSDAARRTDEQITG
jgi:predicted ATP-grasp superfamily ATP-dependent carboligase